MRIILSPEDAIEEALEDIRDCAKEIRDSK